MQQAFGKALSKPVAERPSIDDQKKFVGWMCELAKYEALKNRNDQRRRAEREIALPTDIAEMVAVPPSVGAVEARKTLGRAFMALEPADQELLHKLYSEGKTIQEMADERQRPWTTVKSDLQRILDLLYASIRPAVIALVVLLPKRARAFVANITQRFPQMLVQAVEFGGAMSVTVLCGVLLPAGSSFMTEPSMALGLTPYSPPQTTMAQATPLGPAFNPEVEPEEPEALDAVTNQCSAADMKSTQFASFLQRTVLPLALSATPALAQVACAGTEQQTPPPQQPVDEPKDTHDWDTIAYDQACTFQRARGERCPTREEWDKIGRPR